MNWLERVANKIHPKKEDSKMFLKSRCICKGKYEVNGVVFYADTHQEAIKKYRKGYNYD